jgi:FkbM family methyltransferase
MRLRSVLRRLLQRYTGYDIHEYNPPSDLDYWADISELLSKASSVTAFDVGANLGQTIRTLVRVFPRVSFHAFEPSPSTFSELAEVFAGYDNVTLNNCGVGSQESETDFIENTDSGMSSFLEPGPQIWGEVKQRIKVPMTTVDDYSVEKRIEHIHLLKIDAQGFDLEVIKGADRMLAEGRVDLVLTEVTFAKLYEGLPRVDAVYAYIAQRGYRLTGIYDQRRKRRILSWADMMFASPSIVGERWTASSASRHWTSASRPRKRTPHSATDTPLQKQEVTFRDRCATVAKVKGRGRTTEGLCRR